MTRLLGIIGYPLGHSLSPSFQQAAIDAVGLDLRYQSWELPPEGLASLVARLRGPDYLGANVTVPHKEAVLSLLDELDETARRIGAVNTIVNREGQLIGTNTDAEGFLWALWDDPSFDPAGKRAVLLGAGGAARAVAFALAEAGVSSLLVLNRTPERAQRLVVNLAPYLEPQQRAKALPWSPGTLPKAALPCDLLVNCTPMGTRHGPTEGQSPLGPEAIPPGVLVYDLVYNPLETPLLRAAREAGNPTLGGLPMLVYQGAASFRLWTGQDPPLDVMFSAAQAGLGEE